MDHQANVVVVGGGIAGLLAARTAQHRGARVTLLERSADSPSVNNTVLSGGVFHAAYADPARHTPDQLYQTLMQRGGGDIVPELARAWADNVLRARQLLAREGAQFFAAFDDAEFAANTLKPRRVARRNIVETGSWHNAGPHLLVDRLTHSIVEHDGVIRRGTRAIGLERNHVGVVGVRCENENGATELIRAEAVVLADGGFQGNAELVHRHISRSYHLRGSANDIGDGLLMGLDVGASAVNLRNFYGHALVRDSLHKESLWPEPDGGVFGDEGIVVDGFGERLADEWRGESSHAPIADALAGPIAWSRTPGDCWAIVDERWWEGPGRTGSTPMNPTLVEEGTTVLSATSTEALASAVGVPADALARTLMNYNDYARGATKEIQPARGGRPRPLEGRLLAIPLIAGITFTMGGLLVDRHARVLDAHNGKPIQGLYAAGGTMGGLQGGPQNHAYTGGWSQAAVFGMLAGEHAGQASTLPALRL